MYRKYIPVFIIINLQKKYSSRDTILLFCRATNFLPRCRLLSSATTDSASGPLRACFSTLMQCDKALLETQLNILKARIAGKRGPVFRFRDPVPF